jgi:hypothetical protein
METTVAINHVEKIQIGDVMIRIKKHPDHNLQHQHAYLVELKKGKSKTTYTLWDKVVNSAFKPYFHEDLIDVLLEKLYKDYYYSNNKRFRNRLNSFLSEEWIDSIKVLLNLSE